MEMELEICSDIEVWLLELNQRPYLDLQFMEGLMLRPSGNTEEFKRVGYFNLYFHDLIEGMGTDHHAGFQSRIITII